MKKAPDAPPHTLREALRSLAGNPSQWIARWNWKAAVTSSVVRGAVFFGVNLSAGWRAAQAALVTELVLRALTSGFYGAVTERFSHVEPRWTATVAASVLLPILSHTVELIVHWMRGTEALAASIMASAALTVVSTAFNLHLMRHGVLRVGAGSRPFLEDLRALPRLLGTFVGCRPAAPSISPQST
ncbi:MAG: hypothetical protein AB7I13_11675 [Vicinamibacterales bacterium]